MPAGPHLVRQDQFEEVSSHWASKLLQDIYHRKGLQPQQVVLHSDNGSPMKGATYQETYLQPVRLEDDRQAN